uniref:Uncharacterized protein LOC110212793 n=1 Tax=Phascolarctos cinereus TaxID=38626 RepID=A0A6P5KS60_PHACI|nr:uncharacterized protein LOC110212793 [Phascolarctos cinereus]
MQKLRLQPDPIRQIQQLFSFPPPETNYESTSRYSALNTAEEEGRKRGPDSLEQRGRAPPGSGQSLSAGRGPRLPPPGSGPGAVKTLRRQRRRRRGTPPKLTVRALARRRGRGPGRARTRKGLRSRQHRPVVVPRAGPRPSQQQQQQKQQQRWWEQQQAPPPPRSSSASSRRRLLFPLRCRHRRGSCGIRASFSGARGKARSPRGRRGSLALLQPQPRPLPPPRGAQGPARPVLGSGGRAAPRGARSWSRRKRRRRPRGLWAGARGAGRTAEPALGGGGSRGGGSGSGGGGGDGRVERRGERCVSGEGRGRRSGRARGPVVSYSHPEPSATILGETRISRPRRKLGGLAGRAEYPGRQRERHQGLAGRRGSGLGKLRAVA